MRMLRRLIYQEAKAASNLRIDLFSTYEIAYNLDSINEKSHNEEIHFP